VVGRGSEIVQTSAGPRRVIGIITAAVIGC
jgi:hypothetical protein